MAEVSVATHHVMQADKSKDTKPELVVRHELRVRGLSGYRLHWKKAAGRPDICYPGRKVAVFVQGCYWHRCPYCALPLPKSNVDFWERKFARNRARDERDQRLLVEDGWTVAVVWECHLKQGRRERTMDDLERVIRTAGDPARRGGRLVEVGASAPWRLRMVRERFARPRR